MEVYYLFTIFLFLIYTLNKRLAVFITMIVVPVILIYLPSTDLDYDIYKQSYDSGFFSNEFPYFFEVSMLDSEPFYLWYTSFLSVTTGLEFSGFLALNFLICFLLLKFFFKKMNVDFYLDFVMMFLPVIIPTIFYFSPRSSLSYFLVLIAFFFLVHHKLLITLIIILFAISTHSQFLLISGLLVISYLVFKWMLKKEMGIKPIYTYIIISSVLLTFILFFIEVFLGAILSVLSFLPSGDLAGNKTSYLTGGREGFRFTAILSIFVYPILAYTFSKKTYEPGYTCQLFNKIETEQFFALLFFAVMMYGLSINVAYIDKPHVAGRLSRFSDYTGMGLLIPLVARTIWKNSSFNVILIVFILLAPFIFPAIYHKVNWGF